VRQRADLLERAIEYCNTDLGALVDLDGDFTAEQAKSAYKKKARQMHPDQGGSTAAFQALNAAAEVLCDPEALQTWKAERAWYLG
jgi:DnaJ-class molecular chaperone